MQCTKSFALKVPFSVIVIMLVLSTMAIADEQSFIDELTTKKPQSQKVDSALQRPSKKVEEGKLSSTM